MTLPTSSRSKKNPVRLNPLRLEMLEDRVVPDASISFAGNVIDIVGTSARDVIEITYPSASRVHVRVTTGTDVIQRTIAGINKDTRIELTPRAATTSSTTRRACRCERFGSTGNDTIFGGSGDDDDPRQRRGRL